MALVKKLQKGATIDNSFDEELDRQVGNFRLKSKDERKVRQALVQMKDYLDDSNAKDRSFSTNIVGQTYTISGEGSEKFAGSPDEVGKNWLSGRLKIKDDQDAMSVAAAIYNEALKSQKAKTTQTSDKVESPASKDKRTIVGLSEFAKTKEGFGSDSGEVYKLSLAKTDEDRKKLVMDLSRKAVDKYLGEYEAVKDKYDFEDYQDVLKMKEILNNSESK